MGVIEQTSSGSPSTLRGAPRLPPLLALSSLSIAWLPSRHAYRSGRPVRYHERAGRVRQVRDPIIWCPYSGLVLVGNGGPKSIQNNGKTPAITRNLLFFKFPKMRPGTCLERAAR